MNRGARATSVAIERGDEHKAPRGRWPPGCSEAFEPLWE